MCNKHGEHEYSVGNNDWKNTNTSKKNHQRAIDERDGTKRNSSNQRKVFSTSLEIIGADEVAIAKQLLF